MLGQVGVKLCRMLTHNELVHPKMKISLCFTHPQSILGVYDFLLSDESNRSSIKNWPGPSKPYNGGKFVVKSSRREIKCAHP